MAQGQNGSKANGPSVARSSLPRISRPQSKLRRQPPSRNAFVFLQTGALLNENTHTTLAAQKSIEKRYGGSQSAQDAYTGWLKALQHLKALQNCICLTSGLMACSGFPPEQRNKSKVSETNRGVIEKTFRNEVCLFIFAKIDFFLHFFFHSTLEGGTGLCWPPHPEGGSVWWVPPLWRGEPWLCFKACHEGEPKYRFLGIPWASLHFSTNILLI